jgi:hypothetical protein
MLQQMLIIHVYKELFPNFSSESEIKFITVSFSVYKSYINISIRHIATNVRNREQNVRTQSCHVLDLPGGTEENKEIFSRNFRLPAAV